MNILDVLGDTPDLQWRIARVKRINVGPPYTVDLVMGTTAESEATIATILGASVIADYAPVIGQVVQVLVHTKIGALVLGPLRTAAPPPVVTLPELPRVSQFYGGDAPYNITATDSGSRQNLGGTTMTNPDTSRYILARGDYNAWSTIGAGNAGYLHSLVTGATAALNVGDARLPESLYMDQKGAMMFTIAPGATVTYRATAYKANTSSAFSVNYLRVTITAINWRPNGTI